MLTKGNAKQRSAFNHDVHFLVYLTGGEEHPF
jgi:hypothetical protein